MLVAFELWERKVGLGGASVVWCLRCLVPYLRTGGKPVVYVLGGNRGDDKEHYEDDEQHPQVGLVGELAPHRQRRGIHHGTNRLGDSQEVCYAATCLATNGHEPNGH